MSTAALSRQQPFVFHDVSWRGYLHILRAFEDRRLRITYDQGALEIMTLSPPHEFFKGLLFLLIGTLAEELGWNLVGYGSMTMKRRKKQRGLEPDECFYIQHEAEMRSRDRIDFRKDPPPDLVVEVDWTKSSLDRMGIYASLGVPEVWQYDGKSLRVQLLGAKGKYTLSSRSQAFPFLPLKEVVRFLRMRGAYSETEIVRRFRAWVRERIAADWR